MRDVARDLTAAVANFHIIPDDYASFSMTEDTPAVQSP
jgi:hypothetical protein